MSETASEETICRGCSVFLSDVAVVRSNAVSEASGIAFPYVRVVFLKAASALDLPLIFDFVFVLVHCGQALIFTCFRWLIQRRFCTIDRALMFLPVPHEPASGLRRQRRYYIRLALVELQFILWFIKGRGPGVKRYRSSGDFQQLLHHWQSGSDVHHWRCES